jgi:hypothetical protein
MTAEEFWREGAAGKAHQGRGEADYQHKVAVKQALSEGKPVPASVLADYPDLQKQVPEEKGEKVSDSDLIAQFREASLKSYPSNAARNRVVEPLRQELLARKIAIPDVMSPETKRPSVTETAEEQDRTRSEALQKAREASKPPPPVAEPKAPTDLEKNWKSQIVGKMTEQGATSLDDSEIERTLQNTVGKTNLVRWAKDLRDRGILTEKDIEAKAPEEKAPPPKAEAEPEPKVAPTPQIESQEAISARLPEGKKLKDYTVKVQAIREKTGEKFEVEENAQIALNEVDGKLETYRKLLECINA